MSFQHKSLSEGRWAEMPFLEQMANIGSEVERAMGWLEKGNHDYSQKAFERALELIDLSLGNLKKATYFRELTRLREALVDYFFGSNDFSSSAASWKKYFFHFTYASRRNS